MKPRARATPTIPVSQSEGIASDSAPASAKAALSSRRRLADFAFRSLCSSTLSPPLVIIAEGARRRIYRLFILHGLPEMSISDADFLPPLLCRDPVATRALPRPLPLHLLPQPPEPVQPRLELGLEPLPLRLIETRSR